MEAEKTYQNKVARTIQQKRTGEGALEFADNRPAGILQAVAEPIQRLEDEDETLQGKFEQPLQRMSENKKVLSYAEARRELAKKLGIDDKSHNFHGSNLDAEKKYEKMDEEKGYEWIAKDLLSPLKRQGVEKDYKEAVIQLQKKNETGMPDNLKAGIEDLSGFSMDDVRVHYNSDKPATVQALAYTQGTDIHVAPGQEQHLPHEAWHVAQQMAGRVEPTTEVGGLPVNDNVDLEHEADVMGAKANSY